jgi:plastocyanin
MLHTLPRERAIGIRRPLYFCLQPLWYSHSGSTAGSASKNCARRLTTVTDDGLDDGRDMKSPSRLHPRRVGRILIALVALVAAGAALSACTSPFAAACSPKGASTGTAASSVKVVSDSQTQGAYQPNPVTVQAGQTVTWTWEDQGNQHSVTADDGSFESCLQSAGSTFTTTFAKAGTYPYHCSIHPQMKGSVTVT